MLQTAPLCLPAPGLDAVGECFAAASRELVATDADVIETLARAFDQPSTTHRLKYDAGWLGKGTAPASVVTPYINIASEIFALGFKSHFYPLWLHAFIHGERIGRLEEVFYQGIHALNPVMKLVNMLSEKEALFYQRLAVTNVSSGLLGAKEVAGLLNMPLSLFRIPCRKFMEWMMINMANYSLAVLLGHVRLGFRICYSSTTWEPKRRGCRSWQS